MKSHLLLFGLVTIVPTLVFANDEKSLAESLVELRAEVESLSEQLELERATARESMVGLTERRAELDADLQREQLRLKRLQELMREQDALVARHADVDDALKPALLEAGAGLLEYVDGSLPFRLSERRAAIAAILDKVRTGELSPSRAATRLWAIAQDELRLTKENGLYRQPIELEGKEVLVDVVRIGMVLLFFKTPGGAVGQAVYQGTWRYLPITDDEGVRQVNHLFDSFKKQVRVGYFELPAIIPAEAAQ